MPSAYPGWKLFLSILSLILSVLVWKSGLEQSFDRPSVTPVISLQQQEIAYLAEPAIPSSIKSLLVGINPESALRDSLREIPFDEMDDRKRLLLAGLEPSLEDRKKVLDAPLKETSLYKIQESLINAQPRSLIFSDLLNEAPKLKGDPLLEKVLCIAFDKNEQNCVNRTIAERMAIRLSFSQVLPIVALLTGIVFLFRQIWLLISKRITPWPELLGIPLLPIDMVLLVGGGFVVLGEVVAPIFATPLIVALTKEFPAPISDSVRVIIGYIAMTLPPLFILRAQLKNVDIAQRPVKGWLQWKIRPLATAFFSAGKGWLMIMPIVLLTSWLMNLIVGDQGGSNPLLELVLKSKDFFPITLLILTTVLLAPLFEEVVFRGALLPVLAKSYGNLWGIILSALVFALAHLSVGELPPLFVLGLGLAVLRLSTGRLFPCVLMHALWNGVTFINLLVLRT